MKSKKTLLVLGLFGQIVFGQSVGEKLIHGKIIVESGSVAGVNIINLVNEKSAISDDNGDFYILAKVEDLLVFSSVNLEYYRRLIEEKDLKAEILTIKLMTKTTELDEVVVRDYSKINAVDLGISPSGIKYGTQAERRLRAATAFNPTASAGSMAGGSVSLDPILNLLSGRTAMLKKELVVEGKLSLINQIDAMFEEDYFKKTLKIPLAYIKGFEFYIVENERFTTILKSKDKTKIEFAMVSLAEKYNLIIAAENK